MPQPAKPSRVSPRTGEATPDSAAQPPRMSQAVWLIRETAPQLPRIIWAVTLGGSVLASTLLGRPLPLQGPIANLVTRCVAQSVDHRGDPP